MIVKNIILDMLPSIWPMLLFVTIVTVCIRGACLLKSSRKFVFYKEILNLIFVLYILCLYYILTYQYTSTIQGINLTPFKEMFRYTFGSAKFIKNVVGNVLIFFPFGFFVSYYLNSKKVVTPLVISFIVSFSAEVIQYHIGRIFDIDDIILNVFGGFLGSLLCVGINSIKNKLPSFMRSDWFINTVVVILVILFILFSLGINIFDAL